MVEGRPQGPPGVPVTLASGQAVLPLLVGELNPFGGPDHLALYPIPERCSGGRLARILGLTPRQYLRRFDRTNLCRGAWSLPSARARVDELLREDRSVYVLLGSRVAKAFDVPFLPFTAMEHGVFKPPRSSRTCWFVQLPHPSGLNRLWNEPGAAERARAAVDRALAGAA